MKKILSIILASAMLLALCPAVFAAETAAEFTGYNYVFNSAAYGSLSNISQGDLANYTFDKVDSKQSAPWKLASVYRVASTLRTDYFKLEGTRTNNAEPSFAIKIKVEQGGTYLPELTYTTNSHGGIVDIYLAKEGMSFDYGNVHTNTSNLDNSESLAADKLNCSDTYNIAYYFAKGFPEGTAGTYILKQNLDTHADSGTDVTEDFDKKQLLLEGNTEYYLIVNIDGKSEKLKYTKEDKTEAYYYPYFYLKSFSLTPVQDEGLTEAFKPDDSVTAGDYSEPAVISITKDGSEIKSEKNSDGTHNITAPEINKNGAKFLYWAKGLSAQKRILIGETNVLTNYVPDAEYANYLIPVYEDEVSGTDEYYNANGQLIPKANQETKVSMAGFGTSNGWDKYGDTNIYVAHYDLAKPEKNINITVTGGEGTGTYAFGDTVTCRATGTGTFKCWTKSGIYGATDPEIVSVDETYTFNAWENCTVTAVYADHHYAGNTMKIIIDTFTAGNETGVMAEFIGLDNAVEKGIMFTDSDEKTTKIAMTTKGKQFTVIADGTGTYKGYAIVGNATDGYTQITDGSYSK